MTSSRIGTTDRRGDAALKLTGGALYTADIRLPGMLHAKVLRSPHAHARLVSVDATKARALPGVHAVLTRDDLAGLDPVYGYYIKDQPVVAQDLVRYAGDVVAAVAADDEAVALRALELIEVVYEPLPAVPDIAAALAPDAPELFAEAPPGMLPPYGTGASAALRPRRNVCYEFRYETGPASVWDDCDHVFEDTFAFSRMNHFHLEPFVTVADVRGEEIEIWTSTQNPFPLRKELARVLRTPESRIHVHVPFVGGAFGAKHNCKTEPVAILLSRAAGRPVRYCLTTEEGFLTLSQHAAVLKVKTGVMADGTFVARESEVLLDAGAYSDGSPLVAEKAGYRMPGPYRWQHIRSSCACVMTTTTPAGPFRGFGATQATWASESQVDMIAERLGMDPYALRVKNLKDLGEPFVPGESGIDSDLVEGLDAVAGALGYHGRVRTPNRGMGLAIGFKDGGGVNKPAQARVKITATGSVYVSSGTVEIGQGASTALCQVAAEVLGVPLDRVRYAPVDTDVTPYDQGTNASSGMTVMGTAVLRAAQEARAKVLAFAAGQLDCAPDELTLRDWTVRRAGEAPVALPGLVAGVFGGTGYEFHGEGFFKAPLSHDAPLESPCLFWEVGWAGAEVEVDPETGKVTVLQLVASGDVGRAVNRLLCRGQDEGAAVMGLAQAMFEEMRYEDGALLNGEALDYRVPMAEDLPARFVSITQEQGHGPGPFGAKGAGEGAMVPVAAAVANAVHDATGARVTTLPLSPERVFDALRARTD
ncbi:xanthine dehydrogenase family protein molybdopterin-binding subunit [Streptomyces sp. NBC_00236]|uniref:xanthine dehydrogenase family protein molybdopterin-binding subunit n=1 Tax=unclassified Streptomyces TaxID=2593676 RepID=UPI002E28E6F8|nr:xanthine dehydrogenase family protein molybdopterin-binding subunit [Streptomyces sp. NBC_00236]